MIWSDEEVGAEAVLLLKWEKVDYSSIVKGFAELYGFKTDDNGTRVPELKQSEVIARQFDIWTSLMEYRSYFPLQAWTSALNSRFD